MASHSGAKHNTAPHVMAWHRVFLEGKWIVFERTGPVRSRGFMVSSLGSPKSSPQGGSACNIAFSKQTREEGDDDDDDDDDGGAAHRRPSGGRASGARGGPCRLFSAQTQGREESSVHIV